MKTLRDIESFSLNDAEEFARRGRSTGGMATHRSLALLVAEVDRLRAALAESEATLEAMASREDAGPIPTARGIEYAAMRLRRIARGAYHDGDPAFPATPWSELDARTRAGWRAVAIAVWCQPQTAKTLR